MSPEELPPQRSRALLSTRCGCCGRLARQMRPTGGNPGDKTYAIAAICPTCDTNPLEQKPAPEEET